ncbi:MAG: methyl-accepting chemotaxis protein, partial [Clostridiaceae bacterium]|nr:methyl-accepting chemotaxis protein [Clostridiaceae bacterium]
SGIDGAYNIFEDPKYKQFIESNKWSSKTIPYESTHKLTSQISTQVISAFYKMRVSTNLKSIGTLVVNLKEEYLYNLLKDIKVDYGTKIILIDKNNNIVMDIADRKNNGKKYKADIASKLESNNNSWMNAQIDSKDNLITYYKLGNTDWILVGLTPIVNITKTASSIKYQMIVIGLISITLVFFMSTFITGDITKGLNVLIHRMDKVKDGVLTLEPLPIRKDEVGLLSNRFIQMLETFRGSINDIKSISLTTSLAADEISLNAKKNYEEFETLTTKIMNIQNKSIDQNEDVQVIKDITIIQSNKIEAIISYFINIDKSIINTKALTSGGKESLDILNHKSTQVKSIIEDILLIATEIKHEFREIKKVTESVKKVAKQTDLLALNAEIEAARLGEQGKGFSVIARAVKELATTTSDSTQYIDSITNQLNYKIQDLNNAVQKSEEFITEQADSVVNTTNNFDSIAEMMELMVNQILMVKDEVQDINSIREKINEIMSVLHSSSEDNVITSKEIARSTEEKIELNKEFVELSNHLKELAVNVENKIEKFTL